MLKLTKEDIMNIRTWVTAANMEIHAKRRSDWTASEDETWSKLKQMEKELNADVH